MLAKTHRSFAVASASATLLVLSKTTEVFTDVPPIEAGISMAIVVAVAYLLGTLPDIDQYIPFIAHRGITHAIWIPIGLGYLTWTYRLEPYVAEALLGAFIGYTSHILGDSFSKAGVAFFYPFQRYTRTGTGAFYVKGFRGPFLPLYSVGEKTFISPTLVYYFLSIILLLGILPSII